MKWKNFGVLPSGEWLYWNSTTRDNHGEITEARPVAVNVNGEPVTALDEIQSGWVWGSPTHDLLFVIGTKDSIRPAETVELSLAVIDPAQDTILVSTELRNPILIHSRTLSEISDSTHWTVDGRFVISSYFDQESSQDIFYIFDIEQQSVREFEMLIEVPAGDLSSAGIILLRTENGGVKLANLLTGEELEIQHDILAAESFNWAWNVDGTKALIQQDGLWLLDAMTGELTQISETTRDNAYIPAGPLVSDYYHYEGAFWSPYPESGNFALFQDEIGNLLLFNAEDGSMQNVGVTGSLGWLWTDSDHFQVMTEAYDFPQMDLQTLETMGTANYGSFMWIPGVGSAASAYYAAGADVNPFLLNPETEERIDLASHRARPDRSTDPHDYAAIPNWSADGEWLIFTEIAHISMGSQERYMSIVASADGIVQRDLNQCYQMLHCAQWLPSHVDTEALP